ncbi:uncharacterized protein LOC144871909 [Branchiostoma floridae x Branchiostoma japonicum]
MDEDERFWCDFCGTYEDDAVCPNLGPIQTMQDSEVQSRARASLPKGLTIQNTTDGAEGVFANVPLSERMQFGPVEAKRVQSAPHGKQVFPLKVFSPDGSSLYLDTTDDEVCNWMKFVRPARQGTEQNLVAYQKGTNVFFLTQKDIPIGGELKVWYAPSYAKKMGQHLLTLGRHLSHGGSTLVVPPDKESAATPVQPKANKLSTTSTVSKAGVQEGITNERHTSVGQSKSPESDFHQSKKVTHWEVQENVIKRAAVDPLNSPTIKRGKSRGQSKKKASTLPNGKSVTKAKKVNTNKIKEEKTHSPIPCAGCSEIFEKENGLKEHIEKEHPDRVEQGSKRPRRSSIKSFVCHICHDRFAKNSELLFHHSIHHALYDAEELKDTEPQNWDDEGQDESDEWADNIESNTNEEATVATKRRKLNGPAKKKSVKRRKRKGRGKKKSAELLEYELEHAEQMWCAHCDLAFSSTGTFNQHGRIVHGFLTGQEIKSQAQVTTVDCQHCGAPFCSSLKLKRHCLSLHNSNSKAYKCDTCESEFSLPRDLHNHVKQAASKCKINCQDCGQSFTSLATVRVHQQQKHVNLTCQHCGKECANAGTLSMHASTHVQERQVNEEDMLWCSYCDEVFLPFYFYEHQKDCHSIENDVVNTDKPVHKCLLCQAPFASEALLHSHVLTIHRLEDKGELNTDQKTSVCETCSEGFSGPKDHEAHLKRMEGKCVVSCQDCEERFNSLPSLRFHKVSQHQIAKLTDSSGTTSRHNAPRQKDSDALRWCEYCDQPFQSSDACRKHMAKYHGTGVGIGTSSSVVLEFCNLCNAPFTFKRTLRSHLQEVHKVYPDCALQMDATIAPVHECETCCKKFQGPAQLQAHLEERMGECTMSCQQCGESFESFASLRLHEYHRHSVVECKLCRETFVTVHSLGKHMKKVHENREDRKPDSPDWCQYCDISFAEKKSFTKHMKVYHGVDWSMTDSIGASTKSAMQEKLHICNLCDAPFTSMKSMLKHVQDIHGIYTDSVTSISLNIPKTYKCPTCLKVLQGPKQLQDHLVDRNGQCKMTCKACRETFDSLPLLRLHESNMHRSAKCMLCDATFRNAPGLGKHMKQMHNPDAKAPLGFNQRWCPYCDQTFVYVGNFNKHMKDFHSPSAYSLSSSKKPSGVADALPQCDVCEAPFTTHKLLTKHIHEAHRLPAFTKGDTTEGCAQQRHQCETCCETFRSAKHLDDHLRSSQGKCRATCSKCNETFYRLSSLRVHQAEECGKSRKEEPEGKQSNTLCEDPTITDLESIILATLEQQWCSHCDLTLPTESALSKHMSELHEEGSVPKGAMVFCRTCNSPFTDKAKLLRHYQKLHKISPSSLADLANLVPSSVECGSCQKGFSTVHGLEEHLMVRNRACQVDCKACGLRFPSILRLRWHEYRTHASSEEGPQLGTGIFVCDICSSFFGTTESLANHLSSHAGKDVYQCTVCGKAQPDNTIRQHVLAHNDEVTQDFSCPGCAKTFDQKDALLNHLQTHKLSTNIPWKSKVNLEELISHLEEGRSDTEQKHKCPMCTVVCQSVSHLCTHIKKCKMSTAKTFFSCELCKVRFMSKSALRNHRALQHSGPGEWLGCPQCEYRTQDGMYHLWKHFEEHDQLTKLCEIPRDDTEPTTIVCTLCGTGMPEKALNYHLKKHKKVECIFKCKFCPGEFFTDRQLRQHTDKHIYQDGVITCPLCDCPMRKTRVLSKHLVKVHQRFPYQCPVCQKEMMYRKGYEDHLATHKGDIVLEARLEILTSECDICGKYFAGQNLMKRHKEQVHMNVRKFKCNVCSKDFKRKAELVIHMSVHTGDHPHLCMYCGKSFKIQASLKQHISIHLNIKKHVCQLCGRAFNQKINLRKHLESHNSSKEFQCEACGKTFQHSDTLRLHMRRTHLNEGKSCRYCGKKFLRSAVLQIHEDAVHNGIRNKMCPVCGQVMTYSHTLRRHFRRLHPDLFDKYFPASATGEGNSTETKADGNLGGSAGWSKSPRRGRKRGQKDSFTTLTQEPTPSQPFTMSAGDSSRAQKCEEEEMLNAIDGVVTDSGDGDRDSHTTFIIIGDQNSSGQNTANSAQLVEDQATMATVTTLDHWVPSQFQGGAAVSSCEIILPE